MQTRFRRIISILVVSVENLREKGDMTNATVLSTLQDQIWSLFPAYCSHATDLSLSLKLIAKGIGTSMTKRPDLRLYLLAGLRNLISKSDNGTFNVFEQT
jgi:ribosomal RNA-processing protein 12